MIDFLVNLALNLALKTNQKSTQEAPKIDKKGIENRMQVALEFGPLLRRILVHFGPKLGGKLEPSWPILAVLSCLILPYLTKPGVVAFCLILSYLTLVILGILATTGGSSVEVWGQQVSLGNTTPKRPSKTDFGAQHGPPRPIFEANMAPGSPP